MSRPIELTDALAIEIAGHLIAGNSIADACAMVGLGESTYHGWVKRGDAGESPFLEFAELTRAARADARTKLVKVVQDAALLGDWKAAAWKLERMDRKNWGRESTVKADVTSNGETIQTVIYIPENGRDPTGDPPAAGSADDVPGNAG